MEPLHQQQQQRRRKRLGAVGIMAGCLLYIASSKGPDLEHIVPSHRFMPPESADVVSSPVVAYRRRMMLAAGADPDEGKVVKKIKSPTVLTLRRRTEEEAAEIRRKGLAVAKKRAAKANGGGEDGYMPELSNEMAKIVRSTAHDTSIVNIPPHRKHNVTNYDVDSALLAVRAFHRELLFFVYDAATDDFVVVHNQPTCEWGCKRAYIVAPVLAYALRKNYPQRFQGAKSGDLVFLLSVGDMPRIRRPCLFEDSKYCKSEKWAPILQFGSVLADPIYMPTAIAMPQSPRPHIPCFDEYQTKGSVCQDLQPRVMNAQANAAAVDGSSGLKTGQHFQHGLVFGQTLGLVAKANYWDDLIPQVIWRGTDFMFLHTLFPDMRAPTYEEDIKPKEDTFGQGVSLVRSAIDALWEMGQDKLTPRWRGVLITSEAELEAQGNEPWANIKFASVNVNGEKVPASQSSNLQLLQEKFGIAAIGQSMNMIEHARYKYHIDLGGGGGTTWTGTIEKLALPGVLFHHVTPTEDWFHRHLEPWVHYIPVATDLSDLREKYEWAEANPAEAQRIAEAGTEFAKWIGAPEGFAALYQEHIVEPLGNIILAHQGPRKKYQGKKTLDILLKESKFANQFGVVARCGGWPAESSQCRWTSKKESDEKGPVEIE